MPVSRGTLLLTRPRAESESLAALLNEKGLDSIIDPMLDIVFEPPELPDPLSFDGLVFTSRHGVQGFATLTPQRDMPVYAVGVATALAARRAGFLRVTTGPGNAAGLAPLLQGQYLLHPCGHIFREIPGAMPLLVYRAVASASLGPATLARLQEGTLAAVLFYSPRTARIFTKLAADLDPALFQSVWVLCLSRAVLESACSLPWRGVSIAESPDMAAMLALVTALPWVK